MEDLSFFGLQVIIYNPIPETTIENIIFFYYLNMDIEFILDPTKVLWGSL